MSYNLEDIDVVILSGGLGKRLRPALGNKPKVLAEVNGKAFLDILIDNLLDFGFKRIILSIGYQKEKILEHFREDERREEGYTLVFSEEETSLGTGGALKKAEPLVKSDTFLVMNGDSFCEVDFYKLLDFHINRKTLLTMVLAQSKMTRDYGTIKLDDSYRIEDFKEKLAGGRQETVNAGIYLMEKDIFRQMPGGRVFSLEYDFFPTIKEFGCYGYLVDTELVDIGTPERYEKAKSFFKNKAGLRNG